MIVTQSWLFPFIYVCNYLDPVFIMYFTVSKELLTDQLQIILF